METIEEHPVLPSEDQNKSNMVDNSEEVAFDEEVCHGSNGVAGDTEPNAVDTADVPEACNESEALSECLVNQNETIDNSAMVEEVSGVDAIVPDLDTGTGDAAPIDIVLNPSEIVVAESEVIIDSSEKNTNNENDMIIESTVEVEVKFETEILVEKNDNIIDENDENSVILNELGHNIELNEALCASDVTVNSDNNNCTTRHEVFNKDELLNILEGNDIEDIPDNSDLDQSQSNLTESKLLEAQLALNQLTRLKKKRKKPQERQFRPKRVEKKASPEKTSENKKTHKTDLNSENKKSEKTDLNSENNKSDKTDLDSENKKSEKTDINSENKKTDLNSEIKKSDKTDLNTENKKSVKTDLNSENKKSIKDDFNSAEGKKTQKVHNAEKGKENIVKLLTRDWDDEECPDADKSNQLQEECENLLIETDQLKYEQEIIVKEEDQSSSMSDDIKLNNKNIDDSQPQRRLGRVIKKKVIFDPDNPDTFTKGRTQRDKSKESHSAKEHIKKPKSEHTLERSKSKSPMSKLQWKKPSLKSNRQNKRLSEVDKLLMDEGAVNMIYQLTPEAPKGKKNMRTKAEFIKKLQSSSTPDGKEMKFRERKSAKYEDGDGKIGNKQRTSLSSSVKSPSVCEDFETHSADDSIIYRRHSSSSYSSSCMSPRRLSMDGGGLQNQNGTKLQQSFDIKNESVNNISKDVFMSDMTVSPKDIINKDDCLSIKEKLNSKLSLALKKRKRDAAKNDKPTKQKKLSQDGSELESSINNIDGFKFINVNIEQRLAEISIKKSVDRYNVEVLKELEQALTYINHSKDISITLLSTNCDTCCSDLDLITLLEEHKEKRKNYAYNIAESARSLLSSLEQHSKLVCCGVWGKCSGVALGLVALSDVVFASERSSFGTVLASAAMQPGAAAITDHYGSLSQTMVNNLVVLGRRISASEAQQGGLVTQVIWPDRFIEQVRDMAKDIATQPTQSVLLKKRLLNLKKTGNPQRTFLASLEAERDLLVEYWTSVEGQQVLRTVYNIH